MAETTRSRSEKDTTTEDAHARPFLRWAGGKRWLAPRLKQVIGTVGYSAYVEPFAGGASAFFAIAPTVPATLADSNSELIATYEAIRERPSEVAAAVSRYSNTEAAYYAARAEQATNPVDAAARFLFLNHTNFNGLYRVNKLGKYNVPYGRRGNPIIPTARELTAVSKALESAQLLCQDFEKTIDEAPTGALVYADPPYTTAHNNNGFIKYNQDLFTLDDQERLCRALARHARNGGWFILSNAAHEALASLFRPLGAPITVTRGNTISGNSKGRGRVEEYIFTNFVVAESGGGLD